MQSVCSTMGNPIPTAAIFGDHESNLEISTDGLPVTVLSGFLGAGKTTPSTRY